jgi:uncharacterized protein (DUF58 family)
VGIAAVSLGVLRPPGALADLLLTALLAFLLAGWLLARRAGLSEVEVRRRLPRVATRGDALTIVHEVCQPGPGLLRNLEVCELPDSLGRTTFPALLPGCTLQAATRAFAGQRGLLQLRSVLLRSGDPFGLFAVEERRPLADEVLIRPRPRRADGRLALNRLRRERVGLESSEWESVREWRPGDPLRRVHWRATARRGYPIVRTAPRLRAQALVLALDLGLDGASPAELRRFERAVALAAGVGLSVLERGGALTLVTLGDGADDLALRGRPGATRLLARLAEVEPLLSSDAPSPPAAPADSVLITARLSAGATRSGRPALVLREPEAAPRTPAKAPR